MSRRFQWLIKLPCTANSLANALSVLSSFSASKACQVIKFANRGSFQTIGLVTDVEPFFRALLSDVDRLEKA
jgi:hypothetical protein